MIGEFLSQRSSNAEMFPFDDVILFGINSAIKIDERNWLIE